MSLNQTYDWSPIEIYAYRSIDEYGIMHSSNRASEELSIPNSVIHNDHWLKELMVRDKGRALVR